MSTLLAKLTGKFLCGTRFLLSARMCRNQRPQEAKKPRRQACSTAAKAAVRGLGRPQRACMAGVKTIAMYIARRFPSEFRISSKNTWEYPKTKLLECHKYHIV